MSFEYLEVSYVPHAENAWADALSHIATFDYEQLGGVFIEYLESLSIEGEEDGLKIHQISRSLIRGTQLSII